MPALCVGTFQRDAMCPILYGPVDIGFFMVRPKANKKIIRTLKPKVDLGKLPPRESKMSGKTLEENAQPDLKELLRRMPDWGDGEIFDRRNQQERRNSF